MNIDNWIYSRLSTGSSNLSAVTTHVYPEFLPELKTPPAIIYQTIGFKRNRLNRNKIYSLTCLHNSKSNSETLNDLVYTLFDNSTRYIRETSSSLCIESVSIINQASGYDAENKYWWNNTDVSVWYHF